MLSVAAAVCVDSVFIKALNTAEQEGKLIP